MYRSYSYNNMPEPVKYHPPTRSLENNSKVSKSTVRQHTVKEQRTQKALGNLQNDDIILIIIAAILIINGCDDKLLIIALAYIFLSGYTEGRSITELLQ